MGGWLSGRVPKLCVCEGVLCVFVCVMFFCNVALVPFFFCLIQRYIVLLWV
jgi:hypothetical protein